MFQRAGAAWRLAAKRMDNPNRSQAVIAASDCGLVEPSQPS